MSIKQALEAMDEATKGPWIVEGDEVIQERGDITSDQRDIAYLNMEAGDSEQFGSAEAACNNGIMLAAAPAMADWIKRAIELLRIDDTERYLRDDEIKALLKEATE